MSIAGARLSTSDESAALIGGIVGVVVAFLLVGALIAFLVVRSRRRVGHQGNNATVAASAASTYDRVPVPTENNDYSDRVKVRTVTDHYDTLTPSEL
jgi:hypothetical protein